MHLIHWIVPILGWSVCRTTPFLFGCEWVTRQTELGHYQQKFSGSAFFNAGRQLILPAPAPGASPEQRAPSADHKGKLLRCHFSFFPMWTKQELCKLAAGSENQLRAALCHLAAGTRLLLLGLEGRSDPAFPKPSAFVFTQVSLHMACGLMSFLCNQLQRGGRWNLNTIQSYNVMNQEEVVSCQPFYANP